MKRNKKRVIRSMIEFERTFLPKYHEKKMAQKTKDAHAIGTSLAKESLDKIKEGLAE